MLAAVLELELEEVEPPVVAEEVDPWDLEVHRWPSVGVRRCAVCLPADLHVTAC